MPMQKGSGGVRFSGPGTRQIVGGREWGRGVRVGAKEFRVSSEVLTDELSDWGFGIGFALRIET